MAKRLAAVLVAGALLARPAAASRFIALPFAETPPKGRVSLWQFALYEKRGPKTWRSLNRLDLGLWDGVELGLLVISPERKPSDTWVNLQVRPVKEDKFIPSVSVGLWDAYRRGRWFGAEKVSPSPFVAVGKGYHQGKRYAKAGLNYGFNRLNGLSGGVEFRVLPGTGLIGEYVPRNLRLTGADSWDFGVYQWLGEFVRVRASWMGGNPMVDGFLAYSFAPKP